MFGAGPYGLFYNREAKRILAIDEKFPDFLRDLAESARAGMTLPRALVTAAQGTYGTLTSDIKTMAAQVDWGVDFGEALTRFAQRTKTPLIDRTVSLVVEAQRAGGAQHDHGAATPDRRFGERLVDAQDRHARRRLRQGSRGPEGRAGEEHRIGAVGKQDERGGGALQDRGDGAPGPFDGSQQVGADAMAHHHVVQPELTARGLKDLDVGVGGMEATDARHGDGSP